MQDLTSRDPTSSQTSPWALRYLDMISRSRFEIIWCSVTFERKHWNIIYGHLTDNTYVIIWNPHTSRTTMCIYLNTVYKNICICLCDTCLCTNSWVPHICRDLKSWQLSHPKSWLRRWFSPDKNEDNVTWLMDSSSSISVNEFTLVGTISKNPIQWWIKSIIICLMKDWVNLKSLPWLSCFVSLLIHINLLNKCNDHKFYMICAGAGVCQLR